MPSRSARYRYYVSQALLQNRKVEAGSIAWVPAPDIESLICDGVLSDVSTPPVLELRPIADGGDDCRGSNPAIETAEKIVELCDSFGAASC
jgi:hypothetical protein